MGTPGPTELIIILLFLIMPGILIVIPFWKICSKAGFSGAISLLILVPIANIILIFFLAFSEWPSLKNKTD